MAYLVDWIAKIVTIPVSDLILVEGTRYRLNLSDFHIEVRRLEAEFTEGLWAPFILDHTNTKIDFAGTDYAAFDEVVNGYQVVFAAGPTRVDVVGSNNNVVDVLIPTGIAVVPSNSAGLVNSADLKATTFVGDRGLGITIDSVRGTDSALYPYGNSSNPCKTEDNLETIHTVRRYSAVYLREDFTITQDHSVDRHMWKGDSPAHVTLTLDPGCNVANNNFEYVHLSGKLGAGCVIERCIVGAVTNASSYIYESSLVGPITISDHLTFSTCFPSPAQDDVIIDFDNLAKTVKSTSHNGAHLLIKNMTTGSELHVEGPGGVVTFDSTCTGGIVHGHGGITLVNNGGTFDVWADNTTYSRLIADLPAALVQRVVDGTYTLEGILRALASALGGDITGVGTGTISISGISKDKTRITATEEPNGNRTVTAIDVS